MAFVKSFLFLLFVVPIVSVLLFITSLFTSEEIFIWIFTVFILVNLVLLVFGIIGSGKPFKYVLSTKLRNTLAITTSIIFMILSSLILFSNFVIYEAERLKSGTESVQLSKVDKVTTYKEIYKRFTNQRYDLDNLEKRKVDHITFYYEKNFNPDNVIKLTFETIEAQKEELETLFPKSKALPVKFIIYNDYSKLTSNHEGVVDGKLGGFYDPSNHTIHMDVPTDLELNMNELKATIIHEYVHHMTQSFKEEHGIRSIEPVWFNEGLAAYVEKKNSITYEEEFMDVQFVSFTELDAIEEWNRHLQYKYSPYLQSYLFINYIIENHGNNSISTILLNSDYFSFEEAFEEMVGSPIEMYEREILEVLKNMESTIYELPKLIYQENKPKQALDSLLNVIRIVPNHDIANHNIANIYQDLGDYEKALEYREKVIKLNPDHYHSYSYLATTLLFIDVEKALEAEFTGYEYAKKDQYSNLEYTEDRIEDITYLKENIEKGNPFKGYLSLFKEGNNWTLNERNKTDLIKKVLAEYSDIETDDKDELIELLKEYE